MIIQSTNYHASKYDSENTKLRAELERLSEEYTKILNWQDLVVRALKNPKFSDIYLRMYISLVDNYPALLEGKKVEVDVGDIREFAGGIKESSATRFFQDMATIQAIVYESRYDRKSGHRQSAITPLPDFDAPESFDLKGVERKRKAREAEEKRRKQFRDPRTLFPCEICGGEMEYDLHPFCPHCATPGQVIKGVPASAITIDAEVLEVAEDDFMDAPTVKIKAVKTPILQQPLPAPVVKGKHPRGIACPVCQSSDNWRVQQADWGGSFYVCCCSD